MTSWLGDALLGGAATLTVIFLFFFATTRGTLLWRRLRGHTADQAAHVYSIYRNKHLIRWVDCQPLISAILLCQYGRLVDRIVAHVLETDLSHQRLLMTACAFGNVMPRVAQAAFRAGATELEVVDVIAHELTHAQHKLCGLPLTQTYRIDNAVHLSVPDESVAANLMFFLMHELPPEHQALALREAVRVLKPGGRFYLAEFHRPHARLFRFFSSLYFKVFEPWGLALWSAQDPLEMLQATGQVSCVREPMFGGNFQVIVATKHGSPVCA